MLLVSIRFDVAERHFPMVCLLQGAARFGLGPLELLGSEMVFRREHTAGRRNSSDRTISDAESEVRPNLTNDSGLI